jgi:FkbM family methyltransferase
MSQMNVVSLLLIYAKYRYISYRLLLRIRLGKKRRDEFLQHKRIAVIDFLPDFLPARPYRFNGIKAIPRRGTHDFYMLFIPREADVKPHFKMYPDETFVDVGAGVGSYTLMIAEEYKTKAVRVIAIEAYPENFKALCRNVECNNFKYVKTVNKAVSDSKGVITMYRQNDTHRTRAGQYTSILNTLDVSSNGAACEVECDTLDDIIGNDKVDLMKVDIEGAEVLALKGATNTLKRLRKIIVEVHGDNFEKVRRILEIHEFKLEFITRTESGNMPYIIGSK